MPRESSVTMLTSRAVLLAVCVATACHTVSAANEPCAGNPCNNSTYCVPNANNTAPVCIANGWRPGTCSNAYIHCNKYANCTDSADGNSFICSCPTESTGDGWKNGTGCTLQYKPCATSFDCPANGHCDKTYRCRCNDGYEGDTRVSCTDIKDCPSPKCHDHAICRDIPGSFTCTCDVRNNWIGNGTFCYHVCHKHEDCHAKARCNSNSDCVCNSGYAGDGNNCTDIDECADPKLNDCAEHADCKNTPGSYECTCKNGYWGKGKTCTEMPKMCDEIPGFKSRNRYWIDPDFTGPRKAFVVVCDRIDGVVVTKLTVKTRFPRMIWWHDITLDYGVRAEDIRPLLEHAGYCYQDISFTCKPWVKLFPGMKWYDAYGKGHENWGTNAHQKCTCGLVGGCTGNCYCSGKRWWTVDTGRLFNKKELPLYRMTFAQKSGIYGSAVKWAGDLVCAKKQTGIPKNCHEAKTKYWLDSNKPLVIDPDGDGGAAPFLVWCDVKSYKHTAITFIENMKYTAKPTTSEGFVYKYSATVDQMRALIATSDFCYQDVSFKCKNSPLLGSNGGAVWSKNGKLKYFPGANGVEGACGCGATNSCEMKNVTCNCNIQDGKERKDFGMFMNKADMPVTKVTAALGAGSGEFTVGPMRCSNKQFGIEPNCEKYRSSHKKTHKDSYSYYVDPDGPGGVDPFLVECKFLKNPPIGYTIVHHKEETTKVIGSATWLLQYLQANQAQIDKLKTRSTFCGQEIQVGCKKFNFHYNGADVTWTGAKSNSMKVSELLESCAKDGSKCKCNGQDDTSDKGFFTKMGELPVKSLSFGTTLSQTSSQLSMSIGPLVCAEVFPTCAILKKYLDEKAKSQGERTVTNGKFTIDPDGPGGAAPFVATCTFPATIVEIGNPDDKIDVDPEKPNSGTIGKCFNITYNDGDGNPISPEAITALVQSSDKCIQTLELNCKNAPKTGFVNFTTCDGKEQPGWAGSFGQDKCQCGVNGNCEGGAEAKCNCDAADNVLRRDSGTMIHKDRQPVCQICLSASPFPTAMPKGTPNKYLQYKLSRLECNSNKKGTNGVNCMKARKQYGTPKEAKVEVPVLVNDDNPIPVGCVYYRDPPIGELVVKPEHPVKPPTDPPKPLDITIRYLTIDITRVIIEIKKVQYCSQVIYLFCAGTGAIPMGVSNAYYSFDDVKHNVWTEIPAGNQKLKDACAANKAACDACGQPRGFKVTDKNKLPVKRVTLSLTNVTLVAGHVSCLDIMKSCQHIVENRSMRYKGYISGRRYIIDPDGSGDVDPFIVNCYLDFSRMNGVSEVPTKWDWKSSVNFKNKVPKAGFSMSIYYDGATTTQMDSLTNISGFCWQNVKYLCNNSPLFLSTDSPATYYRTAGKGISKSWGTAKITSDFQGCACAQVGTCNKGYTCNCDAKKTWYNADQGAVTDRDALPLVGVNVGGQTWGQSTADVVVAPLRCSKKAEDPPRHCQHAWAFNYRYGLSYRHSGEFLISPNPRDLKLEPFIVYCDFDMVPGKGVTVVKLKDYAKVNETKVNGHTKTTDFEYLGPTHYQLKALIHASSYCYQGVKFECQGSVMFSQGSYWITEGDTTKHKQTYWGGGRDASSGYGFCACGKTSSCGGLDSSHGQQTRKCNCDIADNVLRRDAGFLTEKPNLPIGEFTYGRYTKFGNVNITVTDLYCSESPINFNECKLGFHDCHEHAECVDQQEGYKCVCKKGWQGKGAILNRNSPKANGRECIDDNECSWNPCHYNAICENLPGSFNCTCKQGYKKVGDMACIDINECADPKLNDCHEDADCKNIPGSYQCRCKSGYRGDGRKNCTQIGQCACFGDPHCRSFDQRMLHFQGECKYVMSQDGCGGETQTFRVEIQNSKKKNKKAGYYSWVDHVYVYTMGYNITLKQGGLIEVNGFQMTQYHDTHILSVLKVLDKIRLQTVHGLEVKWDGSDVVEVNVPQDAAGKTCGLCGNYNGKADDDWIIGPACPNKNGQKTDNFDLFGRSWVTNDTASKCPADCTPTPPPNNTHCNLPEAMVEYECDQILERRDSPFKECLDLKSPEMLKELKYSCMMDGCLNEIDIKAQMCTFAKHLFEHCSTFENLKIDNWRVKTKACKVPECKDGMVYKSCGPSNPKTCLTYNVNVTEQPSGDVCNDGCFCGHGYLQEGDRCIKPEECGCFHNNEYMATGEKVVLPNCGSTIECKGKNVTEVKDFACKTNETCGNEDGVMKCLCKEGLIRNPQTGTCEVDVCYSINCTMPNTDCQNGTCECKEGYTGDCKTCEDVDECKTNTHKCDAKLGQECVNAPGGYHCMCRKGLLPGGDSCDDIDECKFDLDNCGSHSECINTYGGFRCECCSGYKKNDDGKCVRDNSGKSGHAGGKCCACHGPKCDKPGKVCGTDGRTYNSYRSVMITACKHNQKDLKVNYPGPCQDSCSTVTCKQQYSTCDMDRSGIPQCGCPSCDNSTAIFEDDMVCATNKITYISLCHMKKGACEAEFEQKVEVESTGKPCNGTGKPTEPGKWSAWSNCSEPCKQGQQIRTRDANGLNVHTNQTKPCYNVCQNGPCTKNTCEAPGSVCTADSKNVTQCSCPVCADVPEEPICARVGNYIKTFLSQCELDKTVCTDQEESYEVLEPRACEVRPRHCGRIRNFKLYRDENNCVADRQVDLGFCYGGCDDTELCCTGTAHDFKFTILTCPDGSRKNKFLSAVKKCDCIKNADVPKQ